MTLPVKAPELPTYQATSIGYFARQALHNSRTGSVMGVTSKGVFVQLSPRQVIFLSNDAHRGPLTVNLPGITLPAVEVGNPLRISGDDLIFSPQAFQVDTCQSTAWFADPPQRAINWPSVYDRLNRVAQRVLVSKAGAGFSALLEPLLGLQPGTVLATPLAGVLPSVREAQRALRDGLGEASMHALSPIFGLGSGLTPSGDDLVVGILLGLNRYFAHLDADCRAQLNSSAIQLAHEKTTLLSANLIECATFGQADERIINGLDGIMLGTIDPIESAELLCAWGNASGSDVLVGFSLLLTVRDWN